MTHGSLFSGIGGFDLAAEWMGWENIFHCEINKFCQQVLKQHFPGSILYEDIKKTDFSEYNGRINVLSGGFPCQPYSHAGKRKGRHDDRHLWPEYKRAIREIQPDWVVPENVPGLISWDGGLVFEEVQADLEAEGYEVVPFLLPACSVNAPHRRDRIWIIAHAHSRRCERRVHELREVEVEGHDTKNCNPELWETNSWKPDDLPPPIVVRADDGIPNYVDRIKALGNAVVPQVVYQIFKAIEQYENITHGKDI